MPANFADLPPRYLRTPEAARFVGLSIRTLEKHRIYGTGPRYSKLGGRVVYRVEDLQAWVESGAKASTSDPGTATVLPAKRQAQGIPPAASFGAPLTHVGAIAVLVPNANSSNSFGLCPAISRREMRRISWPIPSSASPRPTASRRSTSG